MLMANQQRLSDNTDFQTYFKNLAGQLHHDDITLTSQMCCHVQWMQTYQVSMKYHEEAMKRCYQSHAAVERSLREISLMKE